MGEETIVMVVPGKDGEKVFSLHSALSILLKQQSRRGKQPPGWEIKEGQPYKFENNELIRTGTNRKSKKQPKQQPDTGGEEVSE